VPILWKSLRAPANWPQKALNAAKTCMVAVFGPLFGCPHKHVTLPFNDHQHCLDCGASRLYLFHSNFKRADAVIEVGDWKKHVYPQNAHRVVARKLIERAIVPSAINGRSAVLNPGGENPLFQRRPRVTRDFDRIYDTTNQIIDRHIAAAEEAVR